MKKVLLATNSEYGQANVFLAVGHALQALDKDVQIHFTSFEAISKDVSTSSEHSVKCTPGAEPWAFHLLDGVSFMDSIHASGEATKRLEQVMRQHPTFSSVMAMMSVFPTMLLPWRNSAFVEVYQSFARVIDEVQPDIIVVDSLFTPALTACQHLKLKHIVLSPNTLKDFAAALQPRGAVLWKYPVMGSAFEFPVPWRKIPANVLYCLAQIYHALTDREIRATKGHVKRELGADLVTFETLMFRAPAGLKILIANRSEIDFPLDVIPAHLTPCGPVIRPVPAVADVDTELNGWLSRGPTVFISLGTHRYMEEDEALEMVGAIKQLLSEPATQKEGRIGEVSGRLQVLWKLKRGKPHEEPFYEVGPGTKVYTALQAELESDQVRIADWVKPQPSAVLQAGTVVCSINHGGANSFHDALTCAVPQVVLPAWLDCYDFANRAELLGIGRWGNKKAMPYVTKDELGPILVEVVLGPKASEMRTRVKDLAELCGKTPGVTVAASNILDEIKRSENE
ncbi:glycosyltransferase [Corynascus novoguineensis]|uniref:Glycosyltransferase n=1 Tax=Corynascus novoguineensis TaxID=1126955 RepID=A0AAN7CUX3_9PEZI|nr:glycosyltransferase [Corynascus novoguineensis]